MSFPALLLGQVKSWMERLMNEYEYDELDFEHGECEFAADVGGASWGREWGAWEGAGVSGIYHQRGSAFVSIKWRVPGSREQRRSAVRQRETKRSLTKFEISPIRRQWVHQIV